MDICLLSILQAEYILFSYRLKDLHKYIPLTSLKVLN